MTLAMILLQRRNRTKTKSLPPAQLTSEISQPLGGDELSAARKSDLTLVSHFGYAMCLGALYSWMQELYRPKSPALVKGAVFGAGVWVASYMGWIEMLKLKPRASKLSSQKNAMMIAAHLIWGIFLAVGEEGLRKNGEDLFSGKELGHART